MDPRFNYSDIFDLRKKEWDLEKIKSIVERMFRNIEIFEDWEFVRCEWSSKIKTTVKQELKRSIIRTLKIVLRTPSKKEQVFSIQFPELVNDQFFYIGGFLKIPVFQMFDDPIIYRNTRSGDILKFRSNTMILNVDFLKDGNMNIRLFGKNVPLHKIVALVHTEEEFDNFLKNYDEIESDLAKLLIGRCKNEWKEFPTEEQRINNVGEYFMNNSKEKFKKGDVVKFSFKAAYEIDEYVRSFMKTDSIIFEIVNALIEGYRSDTDLKNKRLRFTEYLLSPLYSKFFEMMILLYKNRNSNFKIAQNIIIEKVNKSEIIHFNFPLNPIGEVSNLIQCTLTGPGAFKKSNVPTHLRNLDESQKGLICPADTPDREGCGVILNMVPTIKIDENGKFLEGDKENITSFPITLSPFVQNDDQTRLQMASNQCKQTIMIKEASPPWIRTGTEGCFLDKTTFLNLAKDKGLVIYKDDSFLVASYDNGECDVLKINYRSMYLNTMDYIETDLNVGDRFSKGDTLTSSKFIKDREACLGQNLLTAVMIWKGYNYEDGIVVSDAVTKKMTSFHYVDLSFDIEPGQILLSLVDEDYIPLPKIGDTLKKGDVFAKIKLLDWEEGYENIHYEPIEKIAQSDCVITNIEIYPNSWNHQIEDFDQYIKTMIQEQNSKYNLLIDSLSRRLPKKEIKNLITYHGLDRLDCKSQMEKYSVKGKQIGGIRINITAVYEEKIGIGDKVANRHGNKGIISKIIPEDQMPTLEDGRKIDIIINPLGIIGRMNVGQLFELHLSEALYCLKNIMMKQKKKEALLTLAKFLNQLYINKEKFNWVLEKILKDYDKTVKEETKEEAINNIKLIIPSFGSPHPKDLLELMKTVGAKTRHKIYDPEEDIFIQNDVVCGYMYFLKLVHRSSEKMSYRSIGPYSKRTSQPLSGKKRQGGHKLGEMEVWSLIAHGAETFLKDMLTTHSDSIGKKSKLLANILQNPELANNEEDDTPQSLKVLESYFLQLGVKIDYEKEETSNDG